MTRISWFLGLALALVLVTACDSAVTVVPTPTAVAALPSVVVFPDETNTPQPAPPTDTPVVVPTATPTPPPTPTAAPTASPTPTPTLEPTATPTALPTASPTLTPSATPTPTPTPSSSPTLPPNMTMLATWTTHFVPSAVLNGNGANIRVPAKRINGTVVKPGQMFQFINAIEPVTDPPYAKGAYIHNGQFVLDPAKGILGGGMCSASTTMFNAALRAGLDIVERHNHAVYIPRYPLGLDATVFSTGNNDGQDVKFINDMATPIVIKAYGLKRAVTFEIWGVNDGRTVKLSKPVITNIVVAPAYFVYTDALPPGVTQHVQDRYDGFHAVVVRTVKDANGKIISKDTFNSQYSMLPGLTNLGRKPGDPPAGTEIPDPNAPPSNP